MINKNNQNFDIKELILSIRTNVDFLDSRKKRTIICTSTVEKEGKSFVAANYAISAAEAGKKVLLVDCDIRKPKVHVNFDLDVGIGFSDFLSGREKWTDAVHKGVRPNLDILPSKHQKAGVTNLFHGESIKTFIKSVKREYDLIILDTPPLLVASEAAILSKYSDGIVYVCGYDMVKKQDLIQAKRILRRAKANIYGIVVNKISQEGYSVGNYGYYSYSYKYSDVD